MSSTSSPKNAERRKKLGKVGKGGLALVLAAGALSSGTYALWNNSATAGAGTITAGRLAVSQGTQTVHDVSGDRTDATVNAPITAKKSHLITSLATYRTVPQDVIQINVPVDLALEGDNLAATLTVDTTAATGTLVGADGITVNYDVYNSAGTKLNASPIAWGTDTPFQFQATSVGQGGTNASGPVILPTTSGGSPELTVVITAEFGDATGATRQTATAALSNIATNFTQTRSGAGFVAPTP